MQTTEKPLAGRAILIVEDSWHLATQLERMLRPLGATIVGPVGTLEEAEDLAAEGQFDSVVMDIRLHEDRADGLVATLADAGKTVVVLTGDVAPPQLAGRVAAWLAKPALPQQIIAALRRTSR